MRKELKLMSVEEVARLQEQIRTLFSDVGELKEDVKEIKQQLANRLPLWATILISVLTGAIGWLLR
jgi:regulator of replication initiation timing